MFPPAWSASPIRAPADRFCAAWVGFGVVVAAAALRSVLAGRPLRAVAAVLVLGGMIAGWRSRWRLWILPGLIAPVYYILGGGAQLGGDRSLAEIDGKLGFAHAVAGLAAVVPGVGWSVLVAAYWLFFPMVIAALVRHGRGGRASAESFQGALFIVYAFGYIGYLVLPAAGPGLAGLWPDLSGGQSLAVGSYEVMRWGSNGADAFPSLHAAISVFLAVLAVRGADRGGRIWLPVAVLVPVAAVLLGYHYVVDVLAGAALGGLAAVSSARLDNSRPYAST